jgi:hypothetical protein
MKLIVRVELDRTQVKTALENYTRTYNPVCYLDVLTELLQSNNINEFNNAIAIGLKSNGCNNAANSKIVGDAARLISQIVSKYFTP